MVTLKVYRPDMQLEIEDFFRICLADLGWDHMPLGRHSDIVNIDEAYMRHGCFWCLYDGDDLIGIVGIHDLDNGKTAEMKRLYVLPDHQGKGHGGYLFKIAMDHAKQKDYKVMRLSTGRDRKAACHLISKYGFIQIERYDGNTFAEMYYELDMKEYNNYADI